MPPHHHVARQIAELLVRKLHRTSRRQLTSAWPWQGGLAAQASHPHQRQHPHQCQHQHAAQV